MRILKRARLIAQAHVWTIFIKLELAKELSYGDKLRHVLESKMDTKWNAKWLQNHAASIPKPMTKNPCFRKGLLTSNMGPQEHPKRGPNMWRQDVHGNCGATCCPRFGPLRLTPGHGPAVSWSYIYIYTCVCQV